MRKIFFLMLALGLSLATSAQNIVKAEYFIDDDKGIGNNTEITITPGQEFTFVFTANLDGLEYGIHNLYVRVKNNLGKWSISAVQPIQVIPSEQTNNVISAEYFIDNDPGVGKGIKIDVGTPGSQITLVYTVDLSSTETGLHTLYTRACDEKNNWSLSASSLILVANPPENINVSAIEYYFSDGLDSTEIHTFSDFTPAPVVELTESEFLANTSGLEYGKTYFLKVRALNSNGLYSSFNSISFNFQELISGIENPALGSLSFYPNPASGIVYLKGIDNLSAENAITYYLYDSQGKLAESGQLENNSINISSIAPGNYLLILKESNNIFNGKIIINH
jgi:hypothetical protein